jgi:hypothetical protein
MGKLAGGETTGVTQRKNPPHPGRLILRPKPVAIATG